MRTSCCLQIESFLAGISGLRHTFLTIKALFIHSSKFRTIIIHFIKKLVQLIYFMQQPQTLYLSLTTTLVYLSFHTQVHSSSRSLPIPDIPHFNSDSSINATAVEY